MAETLKGVFAASMSVLKADLSLDIEAANTPFNVSAIFFS